MTRVMFAVLVALLIRPGGSEARGAFVIPAPTEIPSPGATTPPPVVPVEVVVPESPQETPTPDPIDQPPPGIKATTITLAHVLQSYKTSIGRAVTRIATLRETDSVIAWGETGSYTEIESGRDYVDTLQLGPSSTSNGSYQGQRWRRNENGYTRPVTGVHDENVVSMQTIRRSILGESTDDVSLLGEVTMPEAAFVIEVDPPAGRHEWLFFEKSTGRLVREEEAHVERRIVWTFDDYRTTNGTVQAWHQHYSDGFPKNDMDWRITSLRYNVPVMSTELDVPPSRRVIEFPAGVQSVRLPARIEDGKVIVRVEINGRGLDFALDSGSSSMVIDRDIARELGLQTFGESTQTVAGTFEQSSAVIPTMKIGDLTMNNIIVDSLPFNFDMGAHTRVVGLLGYDFLAGLVAKIDYVAGTVDAFEPSSFGALQGQVFELNMALDDGVPMVGARIGDSTGDYFAVDTGSDVVVVFSAFALAHPDDVADSDDSQTRNFYFPVVQASGVGGGLSLIPTQVKAFHFGGVGFQHFLVFKVRNAPAFEGEDSDGLIGYEFLKYFDVYFDYAHSLLMLQPNKVLRAQAAAAAKP